MDTVHVSGDWDSALSDVSQLDEQTSATLCTITTASPSMSPSRSPTQLPSPSPSQEPSAAPSPGPTLDALSVPSCAVHVTRSGALNLTWEAAPFDDGQTAAA